MKQLDNISVQNSSVSAHSDRDKRYFINYRVLLLAIASLCKLAIAYLSLLLTIAGLNRHGDVAKVRKPFRSALAHNGGNTFAKGQCLK